MNKHSQRMAIEIRQQIEYSFSLSSVSIVSLTIHLQKHEHNLSKLFLFFISKEANMAWIHLENTHNHECACRVGCGLCGSE